MEILEKVGEGRYLVAKNIPLWAFHNLIDIFAVKDLESSFERQGDKVFILTKLTEAEVKEAMEVIG